MIKKIKSVLAGIAALTFIASPMLATGAVYAAEATDPAVPTPSADIGGSLKKGTCLNVDSDCTTSGSASGSINNIISTVIDIFSIVVGVIAVIMIIIGGLKYITSGGDSGNVTGAKNTILYAVIGLVVVALAQIIVRFVLEKSLSATAAG